MQKISFGGKEYIRASEVAKKFRYTQDYVGQLCRNKKVEARRVGRVWYVEPFSVSAYRQTKHQSMKKDVKSKTSTVNKKEEAVSVAIKRESTVRKKPTKNVEPVLRSKTARFASRKHKKAKTIPKTSYDVDEEVLVPIINSTKKKKVAAKKTVRIEKSHTRKVSVTSEVKKDTSFSPEKLPEIYLSGKLKVEESREEEPPEYSQSSDVEESITSSQEDAEIVVTDENVTQDVHEEGSIDVVSGIDDTFDEITDSQNVQDVSFTPSAISSFPSISFFEKPQLIILIIIISAIAGFLILILEYNVIVTVQTESTSLGFAIDQLF